ncbi:hypothetical protein FSBG_01604 [Fusobacterium gonidiaformans 3-1-5R]|uniref:Uncharacterized protein n=1 Tax=Fusobacterium gonidiaformans 3-1-5R TaxID=469605 RepID=E5BHY4_9FUSO|nr:hypothetical protein [Fusobacterium gonidiaformans]EFS22107.1 hypothetical protein FSBG_01604 [Fusobacterium gonidiaformans 3-1-5R]
MMNLWNANAEDLTKKTGTKERFQNSGIYEVKIKEAFISDSTKSQAKAITIVLETEENYGRVNFWFLKGDGTENEFARTTLNRMMYLLKLKADKLKIESKKIKNYKGEEIERAFLPELEGKNIGVILNVKIDGDQINFDVKDFFDIKSKKTSDEILNKTEAYTVEFFTKK